ncbi:hypothetical protein ACLN6N_02520 [Sphingomonas carotinifaciens]|uniref:hypothetical protein n=1 Tax=Sphingomonas carotinifaciens TaxID=1166323 RepID=UPI0039A00408
MLPGEANALLRVLNDADRVVLAPHLELVPFRNGDMIVRGGKHLLPVDRHRPGTRLS